jgi:hypothetical protein
MCAPKHITNKVFESIALNSVFFGMKSQLIMDNIMIIVPINGMIFLKNKTFPLANRMKTKKTSV